MSDIRVTNVKGRTLNIAPDFPDGANMTGVCTATSFSGDGSNLTGVGVPGVSTTVHAGFNDITVSGMTTVVSARFTGPSGASEATWTNSTGVLNLQDDAKVTFGDSADLTITHDASHSYIQETGTGLLYIDATQLIVRKSDGSEDIAKFIENGAVQLYYDNSSTFETVSGGVKVGSAVTITSSGIEATGVGITCASINSGSLSGRRNLILNGLMTIDQRNEGSAVSIDSSSGNPTYGIVDRWMIQNYSGEAARYDISRSSDVPSNQGFSNSLKIDVTTAMGTPSGNNYSALGQYVESQDCVYLNQGNANAESMTLQFWIKSTKTGTSSVTLDRDDGARCYVAEYTINTTDTWEKKTITIPGDTTGTGCAVNNGRGLLLLFPFFAGSSRDQAVGSWAARPGSWYGASANQVNLVDDAANNIFITGVQLERGYVASSPEHRSFGEELALCQRYFYKQSNIGDQSDDAPVGTFFYNSGTTWKGDITYPVTMRDVPSLVVANLTDAFRAYGNGQGHNSDTLGTSDVTRQVARITFVNGSHSTSNLATGVRCNATGSYVYFNAEL